MPSPAARASAGQRRHPGRPGRAGAGPAAPRPAGGWSGGPAAPDDLRAAGRAGAGRWTPGRSRARSRTWSTAATTTGRAAGWTGKRPAGAAWRWPPSSGWTTTGRTPTPPCAAPCAWPPPPARARERGWDRGQPGLGRAVPGETRRRQRPEPASATCWRCDPSNPDAQVGLARALLEQGYDGEAADRADRRRPGGQPAPRPGAGPARGDRARRRGLAGGGRRGGGPPPHQPPGPARRLAGRQPGAACATTAAATRPSATAGWRSARPTATSSPAPPRRWCATAATRTPARWPPTASSATAPTPRLLTSLGNTLLRLGEEDEGLALLRRAWDRDPYDVRTYNLLNLFEKVIPARYVTSPPAALPLPGRAAATGR